MQQRCLGTPESLPVRQLPPLDAHAHIDADIASSDLDDLDALVFAVTRSLDEAEVATQRSDRLAIWGVGCHPGLKKAQDAFDVERFDELLQRTPFVGEVGLDGSSRVPMEQQTRVLAGLLEALASSPRIASLHSYGATAETIEALGTDPPPGIVLHWWLGTPEETKRAVDLGCYFSVNSSGARRAEVMRSIPADRLLTETDHPFGDRRSGPGRRPGQVGDVERAIAVSLDLDPPEVRRLVWANFASLVRLTGCSGQLPRQVRVALAAAT
jgi:TatD DNase family protein